MNKVTIKIKCFLLAISLLFVSQIILSQGNLQTTSKQSGQFFKKRDHLDIDKYSFIGLNGFNNLAIEIGYTIRIKKYKEHHDTYREFSTLFQASFDFQIFPSFRVTPKLSNKYFIETWYSTNFQLLFGADFLLYNDFHIVNYTIRPVIGLHVVAGVTLAYGYNIKLDNNPLIMPTHHNIQLNIPVYFFYMLIPE